jgi:hypothetical protein
MLRLQEKQGDTFLLRVLNEIERIAEEESVPMI